MQPKLLTYLFILFCSTNAFTQFTLEDILSAAHPSNLTAAQKENKVAWVANKEGKRNIWIYDEKNKAQQLTDYQEDDGQGISNLIFRASGNEILFVRGGAPNRAGEIPNPTSDIHAEKRQLLKINEQTKAVDTLAEGSNMVLSPNEQSLAFVKRGQVWLYDFNTQKAAQAFTIRGSARNLTWSSDGQKLAFVSHRGDHSFVGIYEKGKTTINYIAPSVDRDNSPVWSLDGKAIAFMRVPNEKGLLPFMPRRNALPWSIMKHDFATGKTKEIWKAKAGAGSAFRFISARNQLFWTKDNHIVFPYEGNGWTNLWAIKAEGAATAKNLTAGNYEVQFVSIAPDKSSIIFSSNKDDIDRQHIWSVTPSSGKLMQLTTGKGVQWTPVITPNGRAYCLASTGTIAAHAAKIENGKAIAIQSANANFPSNQLVDPEQVVFYSADGMKIHGQLFKPKNWEKGKKYPALLFFHGGSRRQMLLGFHHSGYYHNSFSLNQYMANQGYIVLAVNYRSGIGYGMKFREALNYGARGASEYLDVMGAGLYMRNRADVIADKIGLWGGSYGGYLTALGLAKSSDLFAAGVDIHGVHDWNVVIRNFVPGYQPQKAKEAADLAYQSSPMPYVKDWRSPVLLIHGDDDRNVPFSETVDIAEALRKQGVYFEQLIFPDEVHGFLLHRNWLAAFKASADFFNRMLKE
jgi:dipeptidyl aminopeptidase/acylaminoacyl peptidase